MDLTLHSLAQARKQSLQSWVPIDFSGVTCISKGYQDMTSRPISSKTKWAWVLVPLSSERCHFPSCYIFILRFYSCVFILCVCHFLGKHEEFILPSNVIISSELMPDLATFSSVGCFLCWKKQQLWAKHSLTLWFSFNSCILEFSRDRWGEVNALCKVKAK